MNIDLQIMEYITQHRNIVLDTFFKIITHFGDLMIIWIIIAVYLFYRKKQLSDLKIFAAFALIAWIINDLILKYIIQRDRPFVTSELVTAIIKQPNSYSMPSGHSMSSFFAATFLAYHFPKYRIQFYILAFIIAISRVYVGVHYPSDILVGGIIGTMISLLVIKFIKNKQLSKK